MLLIQGRWHLVVSWILQGLISLTFFLHLQPTFHALPPRKGKTARHENCFLCWGLVKWSQAVSFNSHFFYETNAKFITQESCLLWENFAIVSSISMLKADFFFRKVCFCPCINSAHNFFIFFSSLREVFLSRSIDLCGDLTVGNKTSSWCLSHGSNHGWMKQWHEVD